MSVSEIHTLVQAALDTEVPGLAVALDLAAALRQIYIRARYERRIDYRADPPPPELVPADAAWLDEHLREQGLRP